MGGHSGVSSGQSCPHRPQPWRADPRLWMCPGGAGWALPASEDLGTVGRSVWGARPHRSPAEGSDPPGLALGMFSCCAGTDKAEAGQGSCEQPFLGILSGNSVWILHSCAGWGDAGDLLGHDPTFPFPHSQCSHDSVPWHQCCDRASQALTPPRLWCCPFVQYLLCSGSGTNWSCLFTLHWGNWGTRGEASHRLCFGSECPQPPTSPTAGQRGGGVWAEEQQQDEVTHREMVSSSQMSMGH